MRTTPVIVLFSIAALLFCREFPAHAKKPAPPDLNKLDGTWEIVELTAYGKKVDFNTIKGTKFVFAKDKLNILPPTDKLEQFEKRSFSFKLDPAKAPAQVELTALDGKLKGLVSVGIYELKGDTLRWCQSDAPANTTPGKDKKDSPKVDAPKDFSSPTGSTIYLFTLKRAK